MNRPTEQGRTVMSLSQALSLFKLGAPMHPIFVHFTIALTSTSLIFDALGLGMHLRGFGRQMGGLYVTIFNWLEEPPAFAPALFAGFAAIGLVTMYLL